MSINGYFAELVRKQIAEKIKSNEKLNHILDEAIESDVPYNINVTNITTIITKIILYIYVKRVHKKYNNILRCWNKFKSIYNMY